MTRALSSILAVAIIFGWGSFIAAKGPFPRPSPPGGEVGAKGPYVVLVGINKYADAQIKPRQHGEADAQALYDLFVSKNHLGADPRNVKLLLGSKDPQRKSEPATRANILNALTWVTQNAGKNDLVLVGLFIQAAPLGERVCYFGMDSTFKGRAKNAIAAIEIEHILDKLKSQDFCAFMDVNYLGFDSGKEPAPDATMAQFGREFLGDEDNVTSRVLFLANSGLKPSLNTKSNGLFATVLLEGLTGKADREGYEPDGVITVGELAKYVKDQVPDLARKIGTTNEEKGQIPWIAEGQTSDFILDRNPAVYPKTRERLNKFAALVKEKKLSQELAEEGQILLGRMPRLEAKQNLRKIYQKLADGKIELAAFQAERKTILAGTFLQESEARNYAAMVMKAVETVQQDFIKEVNPGQLVDWAVRGLYLKLNEDLPPTLLQKLENVKALKKADLGKLLIEARMHLGKREDLANGKDITYSLHPMLGKLDKHTDYVDPETLTRMRTDIEGHFYGIGVQIRKNNTRNQLQVVTPLKDSPAYKAGIQANDIITTIVREVDGKGNPLQPPEVIPTKGMTTEEAVKKIMGLEGTKVKLIVEREGSAKPLEFNLIRGKVEVETVLGHKRNSDDSWNYVIDPENKICYVRLTQFSSNTHRDLENLMRKLAKAGIKGFILDLRFNPGGLLPSAVKISDLFIDAGIIVSIRPRNGPAYSYVGKSDGSYTAFPMVCLVNGLSASASEIVSACLQDYNRAVIIGTRTYGKGSVQTIYDFQTGGKLKLTNATYWRPSGKNIHKASTGGKDEEEWGVKPNRGFEVKFSSKEMGDLTEFLREQEIIHRPGYLPPEGKAVFHDRQLESALEYLRGQIRTASKSPNGRKAG